ncbi:hypothetical protein L211DRAFT_884730 [Terfezia boudieri ATCC MYA-4762]|uniref:Uncharacterized protein n=1 Tax=Terfezia boudieri ATCC MYA-4762 TaxID=1051890 RepID=A0A3N4L8A3_9PEZI|nr:hypothetical protein L211DRAFT_884730 [Terfezia boudieri ATCC MYA-4762]
MQDIKCIGNLKTTQEEEGRKLEEVGKEQVRITKDLDQTKMLREAVLETTIRGTKRDRNLHPNLGIYLPIFQADRLVPIPHVRIEPVVSGETSEAADISAKKFVESEPRTAVIYLFLGSSGAGKSALFDRIIYDAQATGCERTKLEEWVPGPQTSPKVLSSIANATKTVATAGNQHSSRTARVAKGCHGSNQEMILAGDESSQVRQANIGPKIAFMLQEIRALLVHYFPPPRGEKQVLYNKLTDSVARNLLTLLEP